MSSFTATVTVRLKTPTRENERQFPSVQENPSQAYDDQIDCHDVVEDSRKNQDEDAGNQGEDWRIRGKRYEKMSGSHLADRRRCGATYYQNEKG